MAYTQYKIVTTLATPAIWAYLKWRQYKGKEDPHRLSERFGRASISRPSGTLWWLHAASVGEAVSLMPLLEEIQARRPDIHLLLTTGTVSSATMLASTLPKGVTHQYIPIDTPAACARFLAHWQPEVGIFTESELWPNMIDAAHNSGTKLALINARMSEKSYTHWQILSGMARRILSSFSVIAAQTPTDAERFQALGAHEVKQLGHLKQDAAELPADDEKVTTWKKAITARPCLVAASFHPGEDELLATLHYTLKTSLPNLLTILVPRHPARAAGMVQSFKEYNLTTQLRSENRALPNADIDCYIADTIGELGLWYRLANVVLIGGSFIPHGGQNPLEAVRLCKPTIIGPHVHNFQLMVDELRAIGGIVQMESTAPDALRAAVNHLLTDESKRHAITSCATTWLENSPPVTKRLTDALLALTQPEVS